MAKQKQGVILRYGLRVKRDRKQPDADFDLGMEFYMIARGGRFKHSDRICGHGMAYHVRKAMEMLWPDMEWQHWAEMIVEAFLKEPGRTACWGPSSSGKSFVFSRCALVLFYANPNGTTVLISSTTRDALSKRIWDYVVSSDKSARKRFEWLAGSLIESKLMLLADSSDTDGRSFKSGVVGIACKKGGKWQGLEEYVGIKNDVIVLIADEAHFMPVGFLDSLANLESNELCYAAIMGNLPDVDNPLGAAAEPKVGWDAILDTDVSRVYDTRWKNGRAIQFVGMDSPNLRFPEGQEPFKKLIGRRYIEQCAENYGRESDKFNMFAAGKVPRSSMNRTVFTRAMCYKFNATGDVKWGHQEVVRGYGLDAAYSGVGGDRTVGFPFIFGKDVTGRWKFWLGTMHVYPGSTMKDVSHSEAIALECKRECEERGIDPSHVFFDGTGRSELTSAFARLWSPSVVPIEFGGPATDRPAPTGEKWRENEDRNKRPGDPKVCRDVYDRFVTELWFSVRVAIQFDQMRGMAEDAILEGCQRKWEIVRGAKYCIETKDDMKERGLRSPDICDGIVSALEGARRLGFPLGKTPEVVKNRTNHWLNHMRDQEWDTMKQEELA
jgi:hypothetical protein